MAADALKSGGVGQARFPDGQFAVPTSVQLVSGVILAWLTGGLPDGLYNVRNGVGADGCPSLYGVADFIRREARGREGA